MVKMTRAAPGRTKVKVVVRRRFDPVVPIHSREEWKCSTREELEEPLALVPPEAVLEPAYVPPPEDPLDPLPPVDPLRPEDPTTGVVEPTPGSGGSDGAGAGAGAGAVVTAGRVGTGIAGGRPDGQPGAGKDEQGSECPHI